ncbi:MAG: hypothetical protein JXR68_01525 [Bacteroidales bacterium]|nr:hypothetical protein [Bacteroidales bacterium]
MKFLFLALSLFLISSTTNSQIFMGWNAGLNNSKVKFDDDEINESFKYIGKPLYGFHGGLSNYFYFSKVLDLKIDMEYTTKGFKYKQTYYYGQKTFNYGQLNMQGQIDLNPYSDVIISPYLGAYVGYWIWGTREQTDLKTGIYEKDKIYLKNDSTFSYNRYDSGLSAGVDFKFPQPNKRLLIIGVIYEYGMITTDVDKVAGWKNRNMSIYLQYFYRLKK